MADEIKNPVDKQTFIEFLNAEIELTLKRVDRPGWSAWALLVAAATCLWVGAEIYHSTHPNKTLVARCILVFCFASELLSVIASWLKPNQRQYTKRNRFIPWSRSVMELHGSMLSIFFGLVWYSALIGYLVWLTWPSMDDGIAPLIGFMFVGAIYSFVQYWKTRDPKRFENVSETDRITKVCTAITQLFFIGYPLYCLGSKQLAINGFTYDVVRLSVCILAAVYAVGIYIRNLFEPPILHSLIELRRNIVLGKVSQIEARSELELILGGWQFGDIFDADMKDLLAKKQLVMDSLTHCDQRFDVCTKALIHAKATPPDEQGKILLKALYEAIVLRFEGARTNMNELKKASGIVKGHLKKYSWSAKESVEEMKQKVDSAIEECEKRAGELRDRVLALKAELDKITSQKN